MAARQDLRDRGRAAYSNLGAALLGQLIARRAGADFGALLEARILAPVGMHSACVATRKQHAAPGWSSTGLPRQPWVQDGYAPAGGVIATIDDLARLAAALLSHTAPGSMSMNPVPGVMTTSPDRQSGMFWIVARRRDTQSMIWHNGATGGYSAFFALFPETRQAVAVLANMSRPSDQQRIALGLAQSRLLRRR
jgi:CubicO group peptidase (beta-lactamase class C family)